MSKDPAVLFYTADYIIGTKFFTWEQKGKYMELLCMQHQEGHLSREDILSIIGEWDDKIIRKFEQDEDGKYYNKRMEIESQKRRNYTTSRLSNLESGKKSLHMEHDMAAHMGAHMENENDNIIINNNIKSNKGGTGGEERGNPPDEHIKKKDELPEGFKEFWDKYPRHVGKQAAIRAFKKIKKSQLPVVMAGLDKAIKSPEWQRNIKNGTLEYIPHASTWLNGLRWEDETTPSAQQPEKKEQQAWERLPWPPDLIKQNPYYAKNCIDHVMRKKLKDFYAAHGIDIERANKEDYL